MSLIESVSGIRGTIGGKRGKSLSPLDIVKYTAAYADLIKSKNPVSKTILLGRDARISGEMIRNLIIGTLIGMGWDVLDLGLSTTPTTAWATPMIQASGGIIITASHNPQQWNALKFLNEKGELLSAEEGEILLRRVRNEFFSFVPVGALGKVQKDFSVWKKHIQHILNLEGVNVEAIRKARLTVVIDAINSVGGIMIPPLLQALGIEKIIEINTQPTGFFNHDPEPLPRHLTEIAKVTKSQKADVGFVVDPDVDRLAIITEQGEPFGEEYTLVSIADYVLSYRPGNTVSNMSSSRALREITEQKGYSYSASTVGEVNVVKKMKEIHAVIGGEGNGGIIYPESHYGRDALVGIALFLTQLVTSGKTVSDLRASYPAYYMAKHRLDLPSSICLEHILQIIRKNYSTASVSNIDGVKIEWSNRWIHIRKSNTEPILRLYAEALTQNEADGLVQSVINLFSSENIL